MSVDFLKVKIYNPVMAQKKILESGEMYLETIFLLKQKNDFVRSVDVVAELGYSKSSVSRGVNLLKDRGFITIDENGKIEFTELGLKYTQNIYERHEVLTAFLEKLGVSSDIAENDACRIEHVISGETLEAIKRFNKK